MSAYATGPMVPQDNSSHPTNFIPQYPQLPPSPGSGNNAPQAYMNMDPQLNRSPGQSQPSQQTQPQSQAPVQPPPKSKKGENTGESKGRLRKACDSCSQRKVKCDEEVPCKACLGLQIPCTYLRQSKRRGPPNRLAESIKRSRYHGDGMSQPSSPTQTSQTAQTLAAFAQQAVLSAEAICPLPIIHSLIDDYFTYIYPLIPVPHKPSFMAALHGREDVHNSTFLALLASMLGCLVAFFPRRPRQHFRHHSVQLQFPNSRSFISRCQQVTLQAQGMGYLQHQFVIQDAITSYLQGITAQNTHDRQSTLMYFKQCLSIMSVTGAHRASSTTARHVGAPQARMVPNGHVLEGPHSDQEDDCITQELKKRTFWMMFVSVRSLQQTGASQWDLLIPPATRSEPYPPLPLEVDDEYLTPAQVFPPPPDLLSVLAGFNANVRVFTTYDDLATFQLLHGADELADWNRQKRLLEKSLRAVKRVCEGLPIELSPNTHTPPSHYNGLQYPSPVPGLVGAQNVNHYASNGFENRPNDYGRIAGGRRIQHDVQKATIYASQLGTRLYLLEKYWTLSDAHQRERPNSSSKSPDVIAPALDQNEPSANQPGMTEQDMANERHDIVKYTLRFLASLHQFNIEPNGISFIIKIRQLATSLLDLNHGRGGILSSNTEEYLKAFLVTLSKLEGSESRREGIDEDEEAQMRYWADLRSMQIIFQQNGGLEPQ